MKHVAGHPSSSVEAWARRQHAQFCQAALIWKEIRDVSTPADRWLGNYFFKNRKKIGSRDRKFLSQTIYSLFRHRQYLSVWAEHLTQQQDPVVLVFLAAFLDGLLSQEEARASAPIEKHTLDLFFEKVEAFLSFKNPEGASTDEIKAMSFRYSFPEWLTQRWQKSFGPDRLREILLLFQKRPPLTVRVNPIKISREKLQAAFRQKGFEVSESTLTPWAIVFRERAAIFDLPEFREGFFEVQDAGSQLVCRAMEPSPGELIWDACAGGGGKSLLLAALLQNKGRIVATDIRPQKLVDLKKRAKRAGLFNVFPADLQRMNEIRIAQKGFDKILVDAPCSGTGTFRRNPDAKWKMNEDVFTRQHEDQVKILKSVLERLKVGGKVYYVTCSLESLENEDVVSRVFSERDDFRMVPLVGFGEPSQWGNRLWPSEENDGFFMACAEKIR